MWAKITVLLFLTFYSQLICSQDYCDLKYDYLWIMGDWDRPDDTIVDKYGGCEINFGHVPFKTQLYPKPITMPNQNMTMSLKDGSLAFYSNGCSIYNNQDSILINGDSLSPGRIYDLVCPHTGYIGGQSMIAIPSSYNDSIFYVFYISFTFNQNQNSPIAVVPEHVYFAEVNILESEGRGRVVSKNNTLLQDTSMMGRPLTAVKHANGKDWWLITPGNWSNSYFLFALDQNGPRYVGTQQIGDIPHYFSGGCQGKFSPSGNIFAWFHPRNGLYILDFDRSTGQLSNFRSVYIDEHIFLTGGCEFSPSGQFIYVNHDTTLYQFDLYEPEPELALVKIADYDYFADPLPTGFFSMESIPDGRILMNVINGSQWLHIIQNPDEKGVLCNFQQHSVKLPTVNNFTIPHFPRYRLGPLGAPPCHPTVSIESDRSETEAPLWIYPNPASTHITISSSFAIEGIAVTDINGTLHHTKNCQGAMETSINVSDMPDGVYIAIVNSENQKHTITQKFIVMHGQ